MPSLALACRLSAVSMALRRAFPSTFSPASLFAAGEQGFWYDVSDFSTLFQDVAGTIPVTAVEQPVGLQLDKSRGLELGPEITQPIPVGAASVVNNNGVVTVTTLSNTSGAGLKLATLLANKSYKVKYKARLLDIGAICGVQGAVSHPALPTNGSFATFDGIVLGNDGYIYFRLAEGQINKRIEVSEFSVRELKGNHRVSPGPTTSRPILRARYNLYLNSETFATQSVSVVAGQYRLRFEGTGTITLSGAATGTLSAGTHTVTCTTGTLTSTVSGVVTRADLRTQGIPTSLPPYQRITTATDYDTVGFPLYLDTDGADDWMRTASTVDFSGSDKVTLVQGLHKRNDTGVILNELSTSAVSNAGAFFTVTGLDISSLYSSLSRGTESSAGAQAAKFNPSQYPAPDTAIISATHDISGDLSRIWRNGVVGIAGTWDKGTGNFRNDYVYFYARAGSSARFNGRDYGQFAISRLLSDEDRTKVQNVFNTAMGGIY